MYIHCYFNRVQENNLFLIFLCSVLKEWSMTLIKDINPMNLNMAIKGRCISVWHSHKLNEEHDPYSLDCVFQDEEVS